MLTLNALTSTEDHRCPAWRKERDIHLISMTQKSIESLSLTQMEDARDGDAIQRGIFQLPLLARMLLNRVMICFCDSNVLAAM